jgi:hypothetical protein
MTMIPAVFKKVKPIKPPFIRDYRVLLVNFRQNLRHFFSFFIKSEGKMRFFFVKLGIFKQGGLFQALIGLEKGFELGVCCASRVKPQKIADQAIFYPANSESSPIIGIFCGIKRKKSTCATGC